MPQLSVAKVRSATHPGGKTKRPVRLGDGAGLCLQIAPGDTKSWLLRFTRHGKAREMGLGAADPDGRAGVSLSEARQLAADARRQLQAGLDPIVERDKAALEHRKAEERGKDQTFRKAAEGYIAAHRSGWKNAKHADQWQSTLEAHVFPALGGHGRRQYQHRGRRRRPEADLAENPGDGVTGQAAGRSRIGLCRRPVAQVALK